MTAIPIAARPMPSQAAAEMAVLDVLRADSAGLVETVPGMLFVALTAGEKSAVGTLVGIACTGTGLIAVVGRMATVVELLAGVDMLSISVECVSRFGAERDPNFCDLCETCDHYCLQGD